MLLDHVRRKVELDGEPSGVVTSRKVMGAYVKHLPGARDLRGAMMQITTYDALESLFRDYLEDRGA